MTRELMATIDDSISGQYKGSFVCVRGCCCCCCCGEAEARKEGSSTQLPRCVCVFVC